MQKYIVFTCITLITSVAAMERMELSIDVPCKLSHQSPEITRVHTQEYLQWLEEQAQQTATNPDHRPAHSYENIKIALQHVGATLNATNDVINSVKNKSGLQRCYGIALADPFSFAGNEETNSGDLYAAIPIAAAHALKTNLFKRILVINEDLDQSAFSVAANYKCKHPVEFMAETHREYYESGNGSLLYPIYPNNNTELSKLFKNKIVTHDKRNTTLWNFIQNSGKDIDLVFYNIDSSKNFTYEDNHLPNMEGRKPNLFALFQKCIPVVFIISGGDYDGSIDIINDINKTAQKITNVSSSDNSQSYSCTLNYPYGSEEHRYHH